MLTFPFDGRHVSERDSPRSTCTLLVRLSPSRSSLNTTVWSPGGTATVTGARPRATPSTHTSIGGVEESTSEAPAAPPADAAVAEPRVGRALVLVGGAGGASGAGG